jgi:hypothetical protein
MYMCLEITTIFFTSVFLRQRSFEALKVFESNPNSYPCLQRRDRRYHVRTSSTRKNAIHARVTRIWKQLDFRIEQLPSTFICLA